MQKRVQYPFNGGAVNGEDGKKKFSTQGVRYIKVKNSEGKWVRKRVTGVKDEEGKITENMGTPSKRGGKRAGSEDRDYDDRKKDSTYHGSKFKPKHARPEDTGDEPVRRKLRDRQPKVPTREFVADMDSQQCDDSEEGERVIKPRKEQKAKPQQPKKFEVVYNEQSDDDSCDSGPIFKRTKKPDDDEEMRESPTKKPTPKKQQTPKKKPSMPQSDICEEDEPKKVRKPSPSPE